MSNKVLQQLGKHILIGSGAIGTCLRQQTYIAGDPVELLNLRNPGAVKFLHKEYKRAGSQILITNTFAANPFVLDETNLADKCRAINQNGVRLAKETAGLDCMVWASVGPLSLGLRSDDYSIDELITVYAEQCNALIDADALVLETFTDVREAEAALFAATATGLPVIFQIGNVGRGRGRWQRVETLLRLAFHADVIAIGTNCQHPNEIVETVEYLAAKTDIPLTAAPNAGNPRIDRGLITYDFTPRDLETVGIRLVDSGAAVVGGCCGTTPEHISRLAPAIVGRTVIKFKKADTKLPKMKSAAGDFGVKLPENRIRRIMSEQKFLISVEIRADRKLRLDQIISGAAQVAEAGADMFDVPDNPGATVGRDAAVVASRIQDALGVPSICHKSVTQSNLLQIHSQLIGCWDLGLRGILAVTGDPPSTGHFGNLAKRVTDMKSSLELLRLIRKLREGKMINGEEIGDPPDFCAGCAVGYCSTGQINWLKKKVEAGAEFIFSQPLFDMKEFELLRDSIAPLNARFFPGIMPLISRRNAEFFADGRIPGIKIPAETVDAFRGIDSSDDQRRFGLEMAIELAKNIAKESKGIYLIVPFGKDCYSEAAELVRSIKASVRNA